MKELLLEDLDRWTTCWNRLGEEAVRQPCLDFLYSWRQAPGDWFDEVAGEFFPRAILWFEVDESPDSYYQSIKELHLANHVIWQLETAVRNPVEAAGQIVEMKRGIDAVNQARNNRMEQLDEIISSWMTADPDDRSVKRQGEPPGLMLDRLSILSLKLYHYRNYSTQSDRVRVIDRQRVELFEFYQEFLRQLSAGQIVFTIYRQCKTYNDKTNNPLLNRRIDG